jgi:tRNA uridine 5-carboxymethylaminomethyl modification enzyme
MNVPRGTAEVVVIGAGHAGCEAALAAARLGVPTALVTFALDKIAAMPCNPSIGGLGKSHIVREIDALGGEMARAADFAAIHFRLLGASKGPAVRARRVQCDYLAYHRYMKMVLKNTPGLTLIEGEVTEILAEGGRVSGVELAGGQRINCRAVVLTAGTFLRGLAHVGLESHPSGRLGDRPANKLSQSLEKLGISLGRLKTGTPPRLAAESIDFSGLEPQPSDPWMTFSLEPPPRLLPPVVCYITRTNQTTSEVIRNSLDRSPLYTGKITGRGPRYCPSIEDKIVRFPQRDSHQVILEPTGLVSGVVYPNGISTSLPADTQQRLVSSIKGLENARIINFGYAIEYDFVRTAQLSPTLACRRLEGLFLAGQINGTSGYEEAAGQGLLAGINAARFIQKKEALTISRSEAYLGVMVDDLINHEVTEPYRMFTARSEFRLLLREDNAWERLAALSERVGLVPQATMQSRQVVEQEIARCRQKLRSLLAPAEPEKDGRRPTLEEKLRRPEVTIEDLSAFLEEKFAPEVLERVEVEVKYQGYIERQLQEVKKLKDLEKKLIPEATVYQDIPGLSSELSEKLARIRPRSLAEAARIEGMTPAALMVLSVWISGRHVPRGTGKKL